MGSQAHRLRGSEAHRLTAQRLTGSQAQRLTGSQAQRLTGSQAHRLTGSQAQRLTGSEAHRLRGAQAQRRRASHRLLVCDRFCTVRRVSRKAADQAMATPGAVKHRQPLLLGSLAEERRFGIQSVADTNPTEPWLGVPMIARDA
jgi:hypothetical protein